MWPLKEADRLMPTAEALADTYGVETRANQVCIWTNQYGKSRVFGLTTGHFNQTLEDADYLSLITRGLLRAAKAWPRWKASARMCAEVVCHLQDRMEYSFCPKCGGPLESRLLKASEPARLVCTQCPFVFFLDPKVAACTVIHQPGGIVLLQRAIEPGYGKWVFPGGYVDRGETVSDAAVREAKEEVNLEVQLVSLLGVYSYRRSPVIIVVYVAETIGGALRAADEALDVRLYTPETIPWNELAFPSTREALRQYVEGDRGGLTAYGKATGRLA
ncbi:MAG: NUDIX domain-containing protein [Acidobacteria bacterium]|nr:NUDIX domain-containing protein [Acidobacteriota bacterium]MCI0625159.1 NUDIX domain-containing protein [Acidobacteriota bacterium]MCI0724409.1 NUDIX domain-containing protein [Acidobacteriota bacterium]